MSNREINWPMLVVAALCLVPVAAGVFLLFADGGQALAWALIGFFGAGVWVLGRKAIWPEQ
ncbi:hypothetical protein ABIE44_002545 [Marmoricola sp. OAE513]|uniref:hypothetical protein n=1 Tax=Marmoricola sp. OAE513 TaxID=2817894 RepID=UPI001AE58333